MIAYLDSSVVLDHILKGGIAIRHTIDFPAVASSELIDIECRRVFFRCRLAGELNDEGLLEALRRYEDLLEGIDLVELSPSIKRRAAESFPTAVRTLDALHLATAIKLSDGEIYSSVQLFSLDTSMNKCARILGFGVPLE